LGGSQNFEWKLLSIQLCVSVAALEVK